MPKPLVHFAQALGHEASDKRLDILQRIGAVGSISEAARGAGVSYKAAWQALETLSNLAGAPLVEKAVGGSGGGGAHLTPAGRQLLEAAGLLSQARSAVLAELEKRSGNGLRLSGLAGLGLRTSMRNQFPCEIKAIAQAQGSARVTLALAHGAVLVAKITNESAELLGLKVGLAALALCKATAVTVGRVIESREALNLLSGEVASVFTPTAATETAVQLAPSLQLVGFAVGADVLAVGQQVVAAIEESAVVIALGG